MSRKEPKTSLPLYEGGDTTVDARAHNVWIKEGMTYINVHVTPGAKQSRVNDITSTHIGLQIAAPAQEGKANAELVRMIANLLEVNKSTVSIERGQRSRDKCICVEDFKGSPEDILRLLQEQ